MGIEEERSFEVRRMRMFSTQSRADKVECSTQRSLTTGLCRVKGVKEMSAQGSSSRLTEGTQPEHREEEMTSTYRFGMAAFWRLQAASVARL